MGYSRVIGYDSIEYASLTDVGIRRGSNQDAHASLLASDPQQWQERGHVFLVADGMGAHAVGELASELAVSIIPHTYHKHVGQSGVPALRKAFIEANASIHAKGQQNPEFGGMGTTTTALLLRPDGAWIGHVGDSRAYRIRNGIIEQMSFDHSLIWEMAKRQGQDPDTLHGIPSNVIVRSLGPEPLVQVDIEGPHIIEPGDIYLLCSDGLSGQVTDAEIGAVASIMPPAEACRMLVDLANLRGGPDNITVVIVRVSSRPSQTAVPSQLPRQRGTSLWPFFALLLGLICTVGATLLALNEWRGLGILIFIVALGSISAGLLGLAILHGAEAKKKSTEPGPSRPRLHRRCPCRIEPTLVERMAKAVAGLEKQVKERQWGMDWDQYLRQLGKADDLQKEGNLANAFREYCRALHLLAETFQQNRTRGENLASIW